MMSYVVAVSGGVDSVVLLDLLASTNAEKQAGYEPIDDGAQLIVAHFDHGIREDSSEDEKLVRGLAEKYGLKYETKRMELGVGASEATAREERYKYLRQCCEKYEATLVTAHHKDDVVETMLINLIRGTGWRGLVPMAGETSDNKNQIVDNTRNSSGNAQAAMSHIERPLLGVKKADIITYAKKRGLLWREDSTNADPKYLRNYVRLQLLPKLRMKDPAVESKFLSINTKVLMLKKDIATELQKILPVSTHTLSNVESPTDNSVLLPRYNLIMWPESVSYEVIYFILSKLDPDWHPSTVQLSRALHFSKTGLPSKELVISKHLKVVAETASVQFKKT